MDTKNTPDILPQLNALIALSLRQLVGINGLNQKITRKHGLGEIVRFLGDLGMDPKDIALVVGSPITSVRTMLTPTQRK